MAVDSVHTSLLAVLIFLETRQSQSITVSLSRSHFDVVFIHSIDEVGDRNHI